ncbi:MAG: acyl carrier protein [Verrucomicrobia bacterium]|nr:acyl carrier protein [Verrucomicrobiota bacterium]
MEPPASNASTSPAPVADPEEKIRQLPAEAQTAYRKFRSTGDAAALDPLIFAILEHFAPRTPARPIAQEPGTALLMDNLGFDSLAITEIVFFTEEVFDIRISNEEILRVRTLDDLRTFIRSKVASRPVG